MSLFKKDDVPIAQIESVWMVGRESLKSYPFALEILQVARDAGEALFEATQSQLGVQARKGRLNEQKEVAARLYTVLGNTVQSLRLHAFGLTHDRKGRLTDPVAWAEYQEITDRLVPEGGRSRLARTGEKLYRQSLWLCGAATMNVPGSDTIVAPLAELVAELKDCLERDKVEKSEWVAASSQLEQRRSDANRLKKASYHLLKCMELFDPSLMLDADAIFAAASAESGPKRASSDDKPAKDPKAPGRSSEEEPRPGSTPPEDEEEDGMTEAELSALEARLGNGSPGPSDTPDGS